MLQDLRLALRGLRLQPGFSIVAVMTLALGVGATTAIFSAVNAVALKPLPFAQPENLYSLKTEMTDGRITTGAVSPLELTRLAAMKDVVHAAGGSLRYEGSLVDREGNPVRAVMQGVVQGFFPLFGVPMAAGREFTADELNPGGEFAAIMSHRAWRTWFGKDPSIIGRSVTMEGGPVTLVGVAGEGFNFPGGADVWFTIKFPPEGTGHSLDSAFVRVRPGATIERVSAAFTPVATSLQKDFPAANAKRIFRVQPLLDAVVGPLKTTLLIILTASALLLLVACINVTSLLLSRGVVRGREMAVRVALGAARWHIFRQLLVESIVLAGLGAAAGLFLAWVGLTLMLRAGASELPRLGEGGLDRTVLLFTLGATVATGLIVGFAPALRLARTDRSGAAGAELLEPAAH